MTVIEIERKAIFQRYNISRNCDGWFNKLLFECVICNRIHNYSAQHNVTQYTSYSRNTRDAIFDFRLEVFTVESHTLVI